MVLFILVVFLAFATNIGIVVNDKIRMQNTADLASYAAAYGEAQILNKLVELNTEIADILADCRANLINNSPYEDCLCQYRSPVADAEIEGCKAELDMAIYDFVLQAMYQSSVEPALEAGYATAEANFTGTRDLTSFMEDLPGSPTFPMSYWINYQTHYMGGGGFPAIANYSQAQTVWVNYMHISWCPGPMCSCCIPMITYPMGDQSNQPLNGWFYKTNT